MKRLLMTGARGFIGSRLLERLEGVYEVFAVTSRENVSGLPGTASWVTADLLNAAEIKRLMERIHPDVCVHLAWDQQTSAYRNAPGNDSWLAASIMLFSAFQASGGRQFLFAGSSGEYEGRAHGISEDGLSGPMSLYGQCKKAASDFFLMRRDSLQIQIARYFTVYGPGDPHRFGAIPSAVCTMLAGEPFTCRSPRDVRDYIYIDDAADATAALLGSDYSGAVNIASGIPRTMREVFSEIADQMDCGELLRYSDPGRAENVLTADTTVLRSILQMRQQTPFKTGIANTVRYWRRMQ